MSRLSEFFDELRGLYPNDWYWKELDVAKTVLPQVKSILRTYERAINVLDQRSWDFIRGEAIKKFSINTEGRGKLSFFNQLNEAFAYRYLIQKGRENVVFMPRKKKKMTPDLSFQKNSETYFCEVKTVGITNAEIELFNLKKSFDSHQRYAELVPFHFERIRCHLTRALEQIKVHGVGFIYLIVNFDDYTLRYYDGHKKQILRYLAQTFPDTEVYVKVGIQSRKRIHHVPHAKIAAYT